MKKFIILLFIISLTAFTFSFTTVWAKEEFILPLYMPGTELKVPTLYLPKEVHVIGIPTSLEIDGEIWEIDQEGRIVQLIYNHIPKFFVPLKEYDWVDYSISVEYYNCNQLEKLKPGHWYMVMPKYQDANGIWHYIKMSEGQGYSWSFRTK